MVCCPSRVSLCRMQLSEAHFGQSVRRGLGAEWPSWLRGHGWGLGAGGFRAPNPAFPAKENPWGVRFGLRRPPGKQQGPGIQGQPSPALPNGEPKAGAKTACVDFLQRGTVRLWFVAQGEFPFAECSSQKLVMCHRCDGASALSGRAGSGGMDGAWAQKTFARPILLPKEGEPVGSGFRALETPSKAAVPREPGVAQLSFALWRAECRGRKQLVLSSCAEAG